MTKIKKWIISILKNKIFILLFLIPSLLWIILTTIFTSFEEIDLIVILFWFLFLVLIMSIIDSITNNKYKNAYKEQNIDKVEIETDKFKNISSIIFNIIFVLYSFFMLYFLDKIFLFLLFVTLLIPLLVIPIFYVILFINSIKILKTSPYPKMRFVPIIILLFFILMLVLVNPIKLSEKNSFKNFDNISNYVKENEKNLTLIAENYLKENKTKIPKKIKTVKVYRNKENGNMVEFFLEDTGGLNATCFGFYYSEKDIPLSFQNNGDKLEKVDKNKWEWNPRGYHNGETIKIMPHWYYYKVSF